MQIHIHTYAHMQVYNALGGAFSASANHHVMYTCLLVQVLTSNSIY